MSIQVALIDKSEIVQKMLSHCLYYFAAEISRFDNFEDDAACFKDKKPDIVFVDWDIKQGDKAVVYSVVEKMKPTPVVLLYRSVDNAQVKDISSNEIPYKVRKPLDPKTIRDTLIELVPKAKESKVHPFLRFPKTEAKDSAPADKANITVPKPALVKESNLQEVNAVKNFLAEANKVNKITEANKVNKIAEANKVEEEKQTSVKQSFLESLKEQTKTLEKQVKDTPFPVQSKLSETSKKTLAQETAFDQSKETDQTLMDSGKEKSNFSEVSAEKTQSRSKVNKEDINIDETTQNDLAPMAIKSSVSTKEITLNSQNVELNEKSILKVLDKYKDTLEFQELMEKVLSEYAKSAVANILQDDKVTDLIQQPLSDFKESKKFKELVEQQIAQYVKKHLPFVIKEVVEQEIKKILGD